MRKQTEKQLNEMLNELHTALYFRVKGDLEINICSSVNFHEGFAFYGTYNRTIAISNGIFITYSAREGEPQYLEIYDTREGVKNYFEFFELRYYNLFELAFCVENSLRRKGVLK